MELICDAWDIIAENLCYIDLLALTAAIPFIRPHIHKDRYDVNKIIRYRLSEIFGNLIDVDEFITELVECNSYISGSFILQCLYNVEWEGSDIDVYSLSTDGSYSGKLKEWLYYLGSREFNLEEDDNRYKELHLTSRTFVATNDAKETSETDSIPIKPIKITKIVLNHIIVNTNPIEISTPDNIHKLYNEPYLLGKRLHNSTIFKFVDTTFDLEICKVVYDGSRLYIRNIFSLFKRKCTADFSTEKYIKRILYQSPDFCDKRIKDNLMNRIQKYEQRGFTIRWSKYGSPQDNNFSNFSEDESSDDILRFINSTKI